MSTLAQSIIIDPQTRLDDARFRWKTALLVFALIAIWSAIFVPTFTQPFGWDDLHGIRSYSFFELLSTFHGPSDPDHVETPALRPIGTLVYHLQGSLFGENIILQRAFILALMTMLLWVLGLLLREVGLSFRQAAIVFVLFVSSRIFSSLALWLVMSALIVTYIFMVLTALYYARWVKRGSNHLLALCCVFATLAVFSREEAYTLPAALPLIWWLSTSNREKYQRPSIGALAIFIIVVIHYILRTIFIRGAPQLGLHSLWAWKAVVSSWFPGGAITVGRTDRLLELGWVGFLVILTVLFVGLRDRRQQGLALGVCLLGLVFCAPQLGALRSFGVALPTLAFFTAISIAAINVLIGYSYSRTEPGLMRSIAIGVCLLGLGIGITAGIRRSIYVAQSLNENSVTMAIANGGVVFDMFPHRETIPEARRQAVLEHLGTLGIHSRDDVTQLLQRKNSGVLDSVAAPLFVAKYGYQSW